MHHSHNVMGYCHFHIHTSRAILITNSSTIFSPSHLMMARDDHPLHPFGWYVNEYKTKVQVMKDARNKFSILSSITKLGL